MNEGWMFLLCGSAALVLIGIVYLSRLPAGAPPALPPPEQSRPRNFDASASLQRSAPPVNPLTPLRLDQVDIISIYRSQPNEARQNGMFELLRAYKKLNDEQREVIERMAHVFSRPQAWHAPNRTPLHVTLPEIELVDREKSILDFYNELPNEGERDRLHRLLLVYDVLDPRQREALRDASVALGPGPYR